MATAPSVKRAFSPLDKELGLLPNHAFTPRLEEGMVRLGTWLPFEPARAQLAFFTGTMVGEATLRRQTELSGAACVQLQTEQVSALPNQACNTQSESEPAKALMSVDGAFVQLVGGEWREVKTLVVGQIQPATFEKGEWVVHTTNLSYFSRLASVREFEEAATLELERRGIFRAAEVGAVNDGAEWCQSFVDYHRPEAVRILDQPHAFEHVALAGRASFGTGQAEGEFEGWFKLQRERVRAGESQAVLEELSQLSEKAQRGGRSEVAETLKREQAYLKERQAQMRYDEFAAAGYPVGSGAVESANKIVVEARLKGTGMRWAEENVNPMLALRNVVCNDRWEESWQACRSWQIRTGRAKIEANQIANQPKIELEAIEQSEGAKPSAKMNTPADKAEERLLVLNPPVRSGVNGSSKPAADHPWRTMPIGKARFNAYAKN